MSPRRTISGRFSQLSGLHELVDIVERIYHCRSAHVVDSRAFFVAYFAWKQKALESLETFSQSASCAVNTHSRCHLVRLSPSACIGRSEEYLGCRMSASSAHLVRLKWIEKENRNYLRWLCSWAFDARKSGEARKSCHLTQDLNLHTPTSALE